MYRVLDDHRRSVNYRPASASPEVGYATSMASSANRYDLVGDYDEDEAIDISFAQKNQQELLCDDVLPSGWYRFLSYGMSRDMATSCPGPGSCGTVAPVWLDMTTRQNLTSNTYSVDACVSWGFGDGGFDNFDCCLFTLPVHVKNCQGFNVYFLGPTQACDIAYCSAPSMKSPSKWPQNENKINQLITNNQLQKEIPQQENEILQKPEVHLSTKGQNTGLKCSHKCETCQIKWNEIDGKGLKTQIINETEDFLSAHTKINHKVFSSFEYLN